MDISVASGIVYGCSGQRLDVYRPEAGRQSHPVVLLWHGRGPDERDVLAPLASATASLGVVCVVPDWRSDAADGGRAHLLESTEFVRQHGADYGGDVVRITLAGWSLGGKTAIGLALDSAARDAWTPHAVVSIAGGYMTPDPLTCRVVMDRLAAADELASPIPVQLIHGVGDEIVGVEQPRRLREALSQRGWPIALTELDADHAGVVMTVYDPEARRCRPTELGDVLRAGHQTAQLIAAAATRM